MKRRQWEHFEPKSPKRIRLKGITREELGIKSSSFLKYNPKTKNNEQTEGPKQPIENDNTAKELQQPKETTERIGN